MMTAVFASKASISRKSVFSNPLTFIHFQLLPAFVLLPTVPLLPLTQSTLSFTTLKPLRLVLVPDVNTSTVGTWAISNPPVKEIIIDAMIFFIFLDISRQDKGFMPVFIVGLSK